MRNKLLLVEDDTMIASGIVYALSNEGYEVIHSKNICEARNEISHSDFDLVQCNMR